MMNQSVKKILLLSYTFPPTPGIGGRRWAKFCKFLTKEGLEFHVIHSDSSPYSGDFWRNDVENNQKIFTYPIPFRFNKIIGNQSPTFVQKVLTKIIVFWANFKNLNPYDNSSFSEKVILKKAKEVIEKNKIKTVLVTGPPFHLFYISTKIKKEFGVKLIVDYRDMWNVYNSDIFSSNYSLPERKRNVVEHELEVLKYADEIWSVNEGMTNNVISLNKNNNKEKFYTVPNGYDKSDFFLNLPKEKSEKIRMFFAGNIVKESFEIVKNFLNSFEQLKHKDPETYSKFEITIYCKTIEKELIDFFESKTDNNFQFINGFLSRDDYYKRLRSVEIGIIFLKEIYRDAFITKFCDFILNENFIIYIGEEGNFSAYIKKHGIGTSYSFDEGYNFFQLLLSSDMKSAYENYDSGIFDLEEISKNVFESLKNQSAIV